MSTQDVDEPVLFDAWYLARRYDISRDRVLKEYKAGRIPGVRFGQQVRFDPTAVDAALRAEAEQRQAEVADGNSSHGARADREVHP